MSLSLPHSFFLKMDQLIVRLILWPVRPFPMLWMCQWLILWYICWVVIISCASRPTSLFSMERLNVLQLTHPRWCLTSAESRDWHFQIRQYTRLILRTDEDKFLAFSALWVRLLGNLLHENGSHLKFYVVS